MIITAAWIICGFLAYGLMKGAIVRRVGNVRKNYQLYWHVHDFSGALKEAGQYQNRDEQTCIVSFCFGPISLFCIFISYIIFRYDGDKLKTEFCLRVPEELKKAL